jgi:hypothetical protein
VPSALAVQRCVRSKLSEPRTNRSFELSSAYTGPSENQTSAEDVIARATAMHDGRGLGLLVAVMRRGCVDELWASKRAPALAANRDLRPPDRRPPRPQGQKLYNKSGSARASRRPQAR